MGELPAGEENLNEYDLKTYNMNPKYFSEKEFFFENDIFKHKLVGKLN